MYLICEPPGDPYYLARIMEFRREKPDDPKSPVAKVLVNWYYRPKDIGKYSIDVRQLYASMQSDECPITSLRGKCRIEHRNEIQEDFEDFRKTPDTFWFNQLYDRYIHRHYEILPSSQAINVPERVKKALDERWKYLVVEPARVKELTSNVKLCKRCRSYCAPNDSVDCGVCHNTYHMACVRPPLLKKPSRGFAWSCGPCSRRQERKLLQKEGDEHMDEVPEEEEEDGQVMAGARSPTKDHGMTDLSTFNQVEIAHSELWPWRYLGIHCKVEDVLQYDDRAIYPRASSRLGPRHQANVTNWYGRPVELIPREVKKRNAKGQGKKDTKSKESQAAAEAERVERANRPRWVQDAPVGYVPRGTDNFDETDPASTATRILIMPEDTAQKPTGFAAVNRPTDSAEELIDDYMTEVRRLAEQYQQVRIAEIGKGANKRSVPQISTNYLDHALRLFTRHNYSKEASLAELQQHHSDQAVGNPVLSKQELAKFEDAVLKHGTEFKLIRKMVKSRPVGQLVRFYYTWKSTPRGKDVRARHEGRRGAKKGRAEASWTEIAEDEDDSAFDNVKAEKHKRRFKCKFCHTTQSRQWRRAPHTGAGAVELIDPKGSTKDKANQLVISLCNRCAYMWRKYGMRYEDPDDLAKSLNQAGGRAQHRKMAEEIFREVIYANEAAKVPTPPLAAQAAASIGIAVTVLPEPPRPKKIKQSIEKDSTPQPASEAPKKARARSPPPPPPRSPTPPPIIPAQPKMKEYDCAVCRTRDDVENGPRISCKDCRLTVHRLCFAVPDSVDGYAWVCEPCQNDRKPEVAVDYSCCICRLQTDREVELIEQPKPSHKKKTDRDREKERMEGELRTKLREDWIANQIKSGRPVFPRDAVKKTASNNWIHTTCAIFIPEIKFANPELMDNVEGMGAVIANPVRSAQVCTFCLSSADSFTTACPSCALPFHPSCALENGCPYGFDVAPVKGSRKDLVATVPFAEESGIMTATIWCNLHQPKTIVHSLNKKTARDDGLTALQAFVREYKTPDLTLTGTARKANLVTQSTKVISNAGSNRRASGMVNGNTKHRGSVAEVNGFANGVSRKQHRCAECGTHASFRWHCVERDALVQQDRVNGVNGHAPSEQTTLCHKCLVRKLQPDHRENDRMDIDDDDELSEEIPEINYFEQVAPPKATSAPRSATPSLYSQQPGLPALGPPGMAPFGNPSAVSVQRSLPSGVEDLFLSRLDSVTISVVNPRAGFRRSFSNREFQLTLEGNPAPAFHHLIRQSQEVCKLDPTRQVIVTEDGTAITSPHLFVSALNLQVQSNVQDSTWFVRDKRELPNGGVGIAGSTPTQTPPAHEHALLSMHSSQGYLGHGSPAPPPGMLGRAPPAGQASRDLRDAPPALMDPRDVAATLHHRGAPPPQGHPVGPPPLSHERPPIGFAGVSGPPPGRGYENRPPAGPTPFGPGPPPPFPGPPLLQHAPQPSPLPPPPAMQPTAGAPGGTSQPPSQHQSPHQAAPTPPAGILAGPPSQLSSYFHGPPPPGASRGPLPLFRDHQQSPAGPLPPARAPTFFGHAPTPPAAATGAGVTARPDETARAARPPSSSSQHPNGTPALGGPGPAMASSAGNTYSSVAPPASSPPVRASTPRDIKTFGASSSPNLKNLMH